MAKSSPKLGIKNVIICEDIRREDNGKQMLLGVYVSNIEVATFPAHLTLAFWVEHEPTALGEVDAEFRILGPNDVELFRSMAHAKFLKTERSSMGMGGIYIQIQGPGEIKFQAKEGGGSWKTYRSIPVRKREIAGTAAKPQSK